MTTSPVSYHGFERAISILPAAPTTGAIVIFGRTRTRVRDLKLQTSTGGASWVTIASTSRGTRKGDGVSFILRWPAKRSSLFTPTTLVRVIGAFRGAPPTAARTRWLGKGGTPPSALPTWRAGASARLVVSESTVFSDTDPESALALFHPPTRVAFSRRLLHVLQMDEARRQGAAFFYDLDQATHDMLLPNAQREALGRLSEQILAGVVDRANAQGPHTWMETRLQGLRRGIEPIQRLFQGLILTHFPGRADQPALRYDGQKLREAVIGFVLGDYAMADTTLGGPDSAYYFCFAELIVLFVALHPTAHGDEQATIAFWRPALEAFVDTARTFADLYRDHGQGTEAFSAAAGAIRLRDEEVVTFARQALLATRSERSWDDLIDEFSRIVKTALPPTTPVAGTPSPAPI